MVLIFSFPFSVFCTYLLLSFESYASFIKWTRKLTSQCLSSLMDGALDPPADGWGQQPAGCFEFLFRFWSSVTLTFVLALVYSVLLYIVSVVERPNMVLEMYHSVPSWLLEFLLRNNYSDPFDLVPVSQLSTCFLFLHRVGALVMMWHRMAPFWSCVLCFKWLLCLESYFFS